MSKALEKSPPGPAITQDGLKAPTLIGVGTSKKISFFLCLLMLGLMAGCASGAPNIVSYDFFNSEVEHVPDLVNSTATDSDVDFVLIQEALEDGLKNRRKLSFLRVISGPTYSYYVFRVTGVEDGYISYAVKQGELLYSFQYSGEANPRF